MAYLNAAAGTQREGSQAAAIVDLTDNSGGTADDTIAAVTGDASVVNAVADLAAKVNTIISALRTHGTIAT